MIHDEHESDLRLTARCSHCDWTRVDVDQGDIATRARDMRALLVAHYEEVHPNQGQEDGG